MKNEQGVLVIVSGPAGAGKSTVISGTAKKRGDIRFSVSATTRRPRPGEQDGKDYYFKTREEFLRLIEAGAFLEYAEYVGNHYGTPAAPVDEALAAGKTVILDIEVQGAAQVLEKRPDAVSIFLCPPSIEELERRLRGRGTETEEKIRQRLMTAHQEYEQAHKYSYIIVNDDIETAVRKLDAVITAEKCRGKYILEGDKLL